MSLHNIKLKNLVLFFLYIHQRNTIYSQYLQELTILIYLLNLCINFGIAMVVAQKQNYLIYNISIINLHMLF